jgi:hypothetical protein
MIALIDQFTRSRCRDTNTMESNFTLLKRGMVGSFYHLSEKHLHRYCDEFSFR